MEQVKKNFKSPPAQYRSIPFWSLNDKLDAEELKLQSAAMKNAGMGGYFLHPREGLETPYLSEEWLEIIRELCDFSSETGMSAWLYDEDKWPSGTAGGRVTKKCDDFRAKAITLELCKTVTVTENAVRAFEVKLENKNLISLEALDYNGKTELQAQDGYEIALFRIELGPKCEWFNNESAADNLNPRCVADFINETYEVYKNTVGGYFGNTIPGVFTDEPNVADSNNVFDGRGWIPYTNDFKDEFFDDLPYLFFVCEKSFKARHDYWYRISRQFTNSYTKQIYDWCCKNNLTFTGHFLFESDWGWGTRSNGSIMPNYCYQHIPAIDMLCDSTNEVLTVKQCASVANQLSRPVVLSEMYAATGWEFDFETQKKIGDWQFVLGVNLRSQHLVLSSIRGCRKRDYPPSFNYNNVWFKYNKVMEDYYARISSVITSGTAKRDLLLLHPQSTAWGKLGCEIIDKGLFEDKSAAELNAFSDQFNEFCKKLMSSHFDFDLGDEQIMERLGKVEKSSLSICDKGYKIVLIYGCETILSSTLKLLLHFVKSGGTLLIMGEKPSRIDGELNLGELAKLLEHENTCSYSTELLSSLLNDIVKIYDRYGNTASDVWYIHKQNDTWDSIFLWSSSDYDGAVIELPVSGAVTELFPLTGGIKDVCVSKKLQIITGFQKNQSRLYLIDKTQKPVIREIGIKPLSVNIFDTKNVICVLNEPVKVTRTMPNALVLDTCRYSVAGGSVSEEMQVWKAQCELRNKLEMRQVFYNGLLQRYHWVNTAHKNDHTPVKLIYHFTVEEVPEKPVSFVFENQKELELRVNGFEYTAKACDWYLDRSFYCFELKHIKAGQNEIAVTLYYQESTELEDSFIVGDFCVNSERAIVKEKDKIGLGDWCLLGYPNYSGSLIYTFHKTMVDSTKCRLFLGETKATITAVFINSKPAGFIPFACENGLEVELQKGENVIELEVMGSNVNTLGPLHLSTKVSMMTNWCSFRSEGELYSQSQILHPYGLITPPVILSLKE